MTADRRFYEIYFDSEPHGQWFVSIALVDGEPVPGTTWIGCRRFEGMTPPVAEIAQPGIELEWSFGGVLMPYVTPRIAEVVEAVAPGELQRIPVEIIGAEQPYEILNVLHCVDCIDHDATVASGRKDDGGYKGVSKLVLRPEVIDKHIFRPKGWEVVLVISEELKAALEEAGLSGVTYTAIALSGGTISDISDLVLDDHGLDATEDLPSGGMAAAGHRPRGSQAPSRAEPGQGAPVPGRVVSARWHEELDAHCERFLGPCRAVLHEIVSVDLHLDLHPHGPTPARQWLTLRTGGVSARPMVVPEGFEARAHAELIAYLSPGWDLEDDEAWWPGWMVKHLGRFVHNERTWFAPGHTVALADPGEVFADHTLFAGVILLAPKVEPRAFDQLVIDGIRCRFLSVWPITEAEMNLALERGSDALRQLMAEAELSHVIDPGRACLVTARRPQ